MHHWNILDGLIIILFITWLIRGFMRGFISQLVSFVGMFIALIAAYIFHSSLAPAVAKVLPVTSWSSYEKYELIITSFNLDSYFYHAVAFGLIFFAVKIGLSLLIHVLNMIAKVPGLNLLNKLGGLLLAMIEVTIIVIIAVNVLAAIPTDGLQRIVTESYIAQKVHELLPHIVDSLHQLWMKYV